MRKLINKQRILHYLDKKNKNSRWGIEIEIEEKNASKWSYGWDRHATLVVWSTGKFCRKLLFYSMILAKNFKLKLKYVLS